MYKCASCGGEMRYAIDQRALLCGSCGTVQTNPKGPAIYQPAAELSIPADIAVGGPDEAVVDPGDRMMHVIVFSCPNCGSQITGDEDTAVTFCSFCGTSTALEKRLSRQRKPDSVVPFAVTQDAAIDSYRSFVKYNPFTPKALRDKSVIERTRAIFMPFWSYDMSFDKDIRFEGDAKAGRDIITYEFTGQAKGRMNNFSVDASSNFCDDLSAAIQPYNLASHREYDPFYVSGFYADAADTDDTLYEPDALDMAAEASTNIVINSHKIDLKINHDALKKTFLEGFQVNEKRLTYYPVWFIANRYGDKIAYGVVNGLTGKVSADLPISFGRFLLGAGLLMVPLFLLLMTLVTLTPLTTTIATLLLAFVQFLLVNNMQDSAFLHQSQLNDRGLLASRGQVDQVIRWQAASKADIGAKTKKVMIRLLISGGLLLLTIFLFSFEAEQLAIYAGFATVLSAIKLIFDGSKALVRSLVSYVKRPKPSFGKKLALLWKPLLGMLACVAVLIMNPVFDQWFYGACIAAIGAILYSFADVLRLHNDLTLRPLPQLGKRGENA